MIYSNLTDLIIGSWGYKACGMTNKRAHAGVGLHSQEPNAGHETRQSRHHHGAPAMHAVMYIIVSLHEITQEQAEIEAETATNAI